MTLSSCGDSGTIHVDLSKGNQEISMVSDRSLTTKCILKIDGYADCDVEIQIPSIKILRFEEGEIKYERGFEWFDNEKVLTVISDSCSTKSFLNIQYNFSAGYFGAN